MRECAYTCANTNEQFETGSPGGGGDTSVGNGGGEEEIGGGRLAEGGGGELTAFIQGAFSC